MALVLAGLGTLPHGWMSPVAGRLAQPDGLPATEAAWVSAEGTTGTSGVLRTGDVEGGAVIYLKFDLPGNTELPAPAGVELVAARGPRPDLVARTAVPVTGGQAATLTWDTAPVLGRVLRTVVPSDDAERVTFEIGVLTEPGAYAFAVTVPPDLGD